MGKKKQQPSEAVASMRARHHAERVAALREGRKERGWVIPNKRAQAARQACRGRHAW
jgi:hypothetical protein